MLLNPWLRLRRLTGQLAWMVLRLIDGYSTRSSCLRWQHATCTELATHASGRFEARITGQPTSAQRATTGPQSNLTPQQYQPTWIYAPLQQAILFGGLHALHPLGESGGTAPTLQLENSAWTFARWAKQLLPGMYLRKPHLPRMLWTATRTLLLHMIYCIL